MMNIILLFDQRILLLPAYNLKSTYLFILLNYYHSGNLKSHFVSNRNWDSCSNELLAMIFEFFELDADLFRYFACCLLGVEAT